MLKKKRKRSSVPEPEDLEQSNGPQSGDVEVVVGNKSFFEHSAVLSSSPVFDAMLRNDMLEGRTKRISIDRCEKEYRVFRSFLQPVTGRKASIVKGNVNFLLEWFHYYQVAPLVHECEVFLLSQPVSIDRLIQAKTFHLKKQYKRCLTEVAEQFVSMPGVEVLVDDADLMRELLPLAQNALKKQKATVLTAFDIAIGEPQPFPRSSDKVGVDPILKTVPRNVPWLVGPGTSTSISVRTQMREFKNAVSKILV
mmetsp:Transcript_63407/g.136401  ORF Transcript_63407/g.136401 Transcript_63407/m.136401 type:complete len:252 (+) Transcript_63407:141-896(+)